MSKNLISHEKYIKIEDISGKVTYSLLSFLGNVSPYKFSKVLFYDNLLISFIMLPRKNNYYLSLMDKYSSAVSEVLEFPSPRSKYT